MFRVLFKVTCKEDIEYVRNIIMARHKSNGDQIIVSDELIQADIVIDIPAIKKRAAIIFDHSGTVHRLGFPDDIEYDSLVDEREGLQSQKRQVKQVERKPKECPKCHYVKAVGVYECPKCGFKPVVREDVETDENRELKALRSKDIVFTPEQKQSWWSQIKFYQKERANQGKPLSDGWCANLYRKKFGVWPRGLHDTITETSPEVCNYIRYSFIAYARGQKGKEQPESISEISKLLRGETRLAMLKTQLQGLVHENG